mmetsp:Transcript_9238/g.25901  ORF Transcript_9238/g.25901 Transcript_9238/m.25901 type:complete len:574 (+) Transcript_9238:41-1762(+)
MLDSRLVKGISRLGYSKPTLVQSSAIPLALKGKDIMARAKTGSGKTAAYVIPILQKIITAKDGHGSSRAGRKVHAVVLVPTRDLCPQVKSQFVELAYYCARLVSVVDLGSITSSKEQRLRLQEKPDIVIATPSRLVPHIKKGMISVKETVESFVIDEADLILSYGYRDSLYQILEQVSRKCQMFLMSATLSSEVEDLKKVALHNAAIVALTEEDDDELSINELYINVPEDDKYLVIITLIMLKILNGKTLFFVNDISRCFRLKLFLDCFYVKAAVVNSELPQNSRMHIVQQFNQGVFDILIATDEDLVGEDEDGDVDEGKRDASTKSRKDKDYGISRGMDFKDVTNVINFDFPPNVKNYVHRVGRTGRAGKTGSALTLVNEEEEGQLEALVKARAQEGHELKSYTFKLGAINSFRYRAEDALRSVTRRAVRDARTKELKLELMRSEKLKSHFQENPKDLELLEHAVSLKKRQGGNPQLRVVPSYLRPVEEMDAISVVEDVKPKRTGRLPKKKKKGDDALRTFKYKGEEAKAAAAEYLESRKRKSSTDSFHGIRGDADLGKQRAEPTKKRRKRG